MLRPDLEVEAMFGTDVQDGDVSHTPSIKDFPSAEPLHTLFNSVHIFCSHLCVHTLQVLVLEVGNRLAPSRVEEVRQFVVLEQRAGS